MKHHYQQDRDVHFCEDKVQEIETVMRVSVDRQRRCTIRDWEWDRLPSGGKILVHKTPATVDESSSQLTLLGS